MMKQKGGAGIVALIILGALLLLGGLVVGYIVSAGNYANSVENQLKASQSDSKNVLANYGQKVIEAAQVPGMYADDLSRVTREAIAGRYGPNGSQAVMQWIQEQNPQFDSSLYGKIQQIIEGGRKDFEIAQRRQIDIRRQYETALGEIPRGWVMRNINGYPKVNLSDFDIVSTDRADDAFRTKKEAPLQLRPNTKNVE